jgi:membrane-associated phospholipid phosphatase
MNAMKLKMIFLFTIIIATSRAHAGFWSDSGNEFVSPVTTDAKYFFYSGSLLTAIFSTHYVKAKVDTPLQKDTTEDKPLGHFSIVGDLAGQMIPNAIYALTAYSLANHFDNSGYNLKAVHMIKSTVYAALFTNILKYTIREPRPNSDHRDAFPSGHATTAFAFASVVGTEHEWYWAVPAYGLATLTAYSRINDNDHHLHDVIAGAVIGTSYGLSIYYLENDKKSTLAKMSVIPFDDGIFVNFSNTF